MYMAHLLSIPQSFPKQQLTTTICQPDTQVNLVPCQVLNPQPIHTQDGRSGVRIPPKDAQNLVMILRSLKEPLTNAMVDIPAFAKKAGLTQGSAKNVLIKMRKKIDDTTVGTSNAEAKAKVKKDPPKKTPATKKRKVENMVETKEESNEEDE